MRKQDNSKLIYLLIGVVAVFILVFQYKSWCSAAEFEIVEKYSEEVEEVLSSIPLEEVVVDDEGVSEFISEAPTLESTSETVVQNFDDSAIVEELKKSNEYWEMFLDSFPVNVTEYVSPIRMDGLVINPSGTKAYISTNTARFSFYFPIVAGRTYSFSYTKGSSFQGCFGIYSSLPSDSTEILPYFASTVDTSVTSYEYTFVAPFDGYVIYGLAWGGNGFAAINGSCSVSYDRLDSYTLSELGNAVIQNGNNVSEILVYVLITCCFVCCFISLQIAWHTRLQIRKWSGKDSH